MKKIFAIVLSAALLLMGTQANAQLSFGAGYLNSTLKVNSDNTNFNGFYLGGSYNIHLVAGLGVAPGLYYSMVSKKMQDGAAVKIPGVAIFSQNLAFNWTEHALNVPINFNYGFDLARDTRVFLFAGPTLQLGLASAVKLSAKGIVTDNLKGDCYKDGDYNRFNCLLGGGVGFEVADVQITIGYDYGLLDLSPKDGNVSTHRSFLKIGAAYIF